MSALFEEMTIGSLTARNRIVRAATAESLAEPSGRPTRRLVDLYRELAEGGAGTIVTGYAFVMPDGKPSEGALGLHDDAFLVDYRALAAAAHDAGAAIVAQLVYGGSKSKLGPDDPRRIALPGGEGDARVEANARVEGDARVEASARGEANARILGPSPIANPKTGIVPVQASRDDLARVVRAFADAAARAKACGFDGVEIHAAHGYLLSQFLDGRLNARDDEYGGTLDKRARLAMECIAAVRGATGAGFPIFAKLNCCDVWDDECGAAGGLSEDESARVAAWLVEAGADCIEVSGDWHAAASRVAEGEPYFAGFGARLARALDAAVIVTGGWRGPDVVEAHLQSDGITGIGMSRPLICEPDLPARWLAGDFSPSRCTACGYCQKYPGIPCAFKNA